MEEEKTIDYHVDKDKGRIGYIELDHISFNLAYGYKTLFTYFLEI